MGAPKQKWTSEEESALKSGVIKHGPGKWRTILKDPEFSGVLYLRSNVDLKDKWRNMHAIANGFGPRDKCTITVRRMPHVARHDEASLALNIVPGGEDMMDGKTDASVHGVHSSSMQVAGSKKSKIRVENLIMEAISTLNEPSGSHKTSIANYIEEQYWPPHDFKGILSTKLKHLTARGKLIKVKRRYRITPTFCEKRTPSLMSDERPLISPRVERGDINMLTKSQIDIELAKMRTMTPDEAAAAAARAVTEAEAAIAEAEEAAREAEAAEADAEAAQAFAEAAMKTLRARTAPKMVINYGGQSAQNRMIRV